MSDGMYLVMRSAGLHELVAFLDPDTNTCVSFYLMKQYMEWSLTSRLFESFVETFRKSSVVAPTAWSLKFKSNSTISMLSSTFFSLNPKFSHYYNYVGIDYVARFNATI